MQKIEVTVSNRTVVRLIALVVGTGLMVRFFGNIAHPMTLIFVAFFSALAINPMVVFFAKRLKIKSRVKATGVAYALVLMVLVGFFSLIGPSFVRQTTHFVKDIPKIVQDFKTQDSGIARFARRYKLDDQLDDITKNWQTKINSANSPFISIASRVGGTIISILTVLVLTFMMLVEGPSWVDKIWQRHPDNEKEKRRKKIASRMYATVTGFVNGQVALGLMAATFTLLSSFIASKIIGVDINVMALAGIMALFGIIPMIGNPIGSAIVILFCLFSSVTLAVVMLVCLVAYFQIENITLLPYIQSKHNELTPMTVFMAALVGIGFGGVLGGLVAIPAMGCLKIILEDYLEHRKA